MYLKLLYLFMVLIILLQYRPVSPGNIENAGSALAEYQPKDLLASLDVPWAYIEECTPVQEKRGIKLTSEDQELIIRLGNGIYNWKAGVRKDGNPTYPYWECGEQLDYNQAWLRAHEWAENIVYWSRYNEKKYGRPINPWGIAGTTALESAFDLCALGLYPRKAAYTTIYNKQPILTPNKRTVSHPRDEIINTINHPKMRKQFRSFDLGGLQTLDRFYDGDPSDLLTWSGYAWQISWMYHYVRTFKTDKPWAYWPGRFCEAKHNRVVWYARQLGATREDVL